MKAAPKRIGEARVLRYAVLGEEAAEACPGTVASDLGGPAAGLALCRYDGRHAVFLFHCDALWEPIADEWFETYPEALDQARRHYPGVHLTWSRVPREGIFPLVTAKLSAASRAFAERLFRELPEAEFHAKMDGDEDAHLLVETPSPTGDPDRQLTVWMESGEEPSLGFGGWHTHADLLEREEELIEIARAILEERCGVIYDLGVETSIFGGLLDLDDESELLEELTCPHGSGRVRIHTWSGRGDRDVEVGDLD